jgi:ketosteroid isomerase-like protein
LALATTLALPAALAAQGIGPHTPLSTTADAIAKVRTAYVDAYNAQDASAANGIYTPDAVLLSGNGGATGEIPTFGRHAPEPAGAGETAAIRSTGLRIYGSTALDIGTWTTKSSAGSANVRHYLAVFRHGVRGWKLEALALVPKAG